MGDFLIESLHIDVKEKRNIQWHLLKNRKADFIHNPNSRCRDHCDEIFQWEDRQGQTPDTTKKTEFVTKERDEVQWMENN